MTPEELAARIRCGPFGSKTAAVFDFDGTLIDGRTREDVLELGERLFAEELFRDPW
jgi:phosphoserine phosphatase